MPKKKQTSHEGRAATRRYAVKPHKAKRVASLERRRSSKQFRKKFVRWGIITAVALVGLAVIAGLVLPGVMPLLSRSPGSVDNTPIDSTQATTEVLRVGSQGADHINPGQSHPLYNTVPPTSGWHYETPAAWGAHTEAVQNETQIHNLEHGGVLIQYETTDQDLITKLGAFARKQKDYPCYLLVAPYPGIKDSAGTAHPISLTAWTALRYLDSYDEQVLQKFVDDFRDKGPEKVACTP
ncbi:MAG: DUF3105 domain-containing protein [Chloroflexi bacterium]|nr:DUF3105 domain-containing protein [Chloroflexota bacterium]